MLVMIVGGVPGETFKQTGADTAASLTAANLLKGTIERKCSSVLITVEDAPIRYAFGGAVPLQNGNLGHQAEVGDILQLNCFDQASSFQFINSMNGLNAKLMISVFF